MSVTLNKPVQSKLDDGCYLGDKRLSVPSYGSISLMGRERTMGDAVMVAPGLVYGKGNELSFYAIFHSGGSGKAANGWRDRLHLLLLKQLEGQMVDNREGTIDWVEVMKGCFAEMNEEERRSVVMRRKEMAAMVAVVTGKEVILAVTGDSRAVLYRGGGNALFLTHNHQLDMPDTRQRCSHDQNPSILSVPEVTIKEQTREDEFLIMASDRMWEIISKETGYNITKTCLDSYIRENKFHEVGWATEAAALLAELAMAKGGQDNISVIVVNLKTV